MPYRQLIRLLPDGSTEWAAFNRDGSVLQGSLPGLPTGVADEVVLLLAAERVLLLEAPRVARTTQQLQRALPFAIEDQLAGPVEAAQVAFAEPGNSDSVAVAVVERAWLAAQLQRLRAAGVEIDRCYAESQCLPEQAVWFTDQRVMVRQGRSRTLCFPRADWASWQDWLQRQCAPFAANQYWCSDADAPVAAQSIGSDTLSWLQRQLPGTSAPNLLQGDFPPRRRQSAGRASWRWAISLAAAAAIAAVAVLLVELQSLQQLVATRQTAMAEQLRRAVPGVQRVVDPLAQMRAALGGRQAATGDAIALLGRIAPLLAGTSRFTLENLNYRGGVLELTLVAADVATLDGLREQMVSLGLQAELTAAVPGTRGVEGRLRLRGAGA